MRDAISSWLGLVFLVGAALAAVSIDIVRYPSRGELATRRSTLRVMRVVLILLVVGIAISTVVRMAPYV